MVVEDDKNETHMDTVSEQPLPAGRVSPRRSRDVVTFGPTPNADLDVGHELFSRPAAINHDIMMGPILRRKKVVSMPLGAGGDFFCRDETSPAAQQQHFMENETRRNRVRQMSHTGHANKVSDMAGVSPSTSPGPSRSNSRQNSGTGAGVMSGLLRRKQVSLDLLGPNDFFAQPAEMEELLPPMPEGEAVDGEEQAPGDHAPMKRLIRPLRFAPRMVPKHGGGGPHGGGHGGGAPLLPVMESSGIDDETVEAFESYTRSNRDLRLQLSSLSNKLKEQDVTPEVNAFLDSINETHSGMEPKETLLKSKLSSSSRHPTMSTLTESEDIGASARQNEKEEEEQTETEYDGIIRASRGDKIKTGVLFCIMLALTIVVATWDTHLDTDSFIQGPVGLACVSDCEGNLETRDFFYGHYHFEEGEVIQLTMHMDPNIVAHENETYVTVEVYGTESEDVKATQVFGPPDDEVRHHLEESILVNFDDPHEAHIINIYGSDKDIPISFTLSAHVQAPLADHSELVAALIMVFVYIFILLEVIHRTLVAIFGSMIALMFFFIMNEGATESIRQIMLHLEWSTLGLLFGMMLLVGELSHTGIFEWCAVRLLVASKGSFTRLLVLLCTLTAIASAFLDNVTTMLLVAPVTIDMCNILGVDPRPYLIGEVLLSNIGGTATLIGDPPNIIIGSSFEEIGFVDFIIHIMPCIFLFCVPVSLVMVCWIYRHYLTTSKMRVLDTGKLKKTYPIYDQPRLMIAGTSTFFVILMFFLHPVHHKDTAWIALLGAFITIAFTNPHDVQEALRSHVEWDTLLFFAGLFVLVEVCAAMGLLRLIGDTLANYIEDQEEDKQLSVAITLLLWVSAITSAFLDNIPYTATMIPIVQILADSLPDTLPIETLAWALSLGACLGGNGTLLGASANIVTAGISTNKGFEISFLNFLYPGMMVMFVTVAIANLYMLVRYVWV